MSRGKRPKITVALFIGAGLATAVAIYLAAQRSSWVVSGGRIVEPATRRATVSPDPNTPDPKVQRVVEKTAERPKVDVVFVLDTTGSMAGLIEGAKRKIWSIANQIVNGQPRPEVRIGLVGYRDHGDAYVTRRFQLTEEIDDVYRRLMRFRADGGGDTPEHVNRALSEALRRMTWRRGDKVLRMVFLVGDAPPHEGRDGLHSARLAREAKRKGIVINTVRCGTMYGTQRAWRRIARAAGGIYASIRQDGAMVAMTTPVDKRLAELNRKLSSTLLISGSTRDRTAAKRRARSNAGMGGLSQAESAAFRARSGRLDGADMLARIARGKKLKDFKKEELPAPLAGLSLEAQRTHLNKIATKRAALNDEIRRLAKKRKRHIRARRKGKRATSFDDTIGAALKKQGGRAGLKY